MTNHSWPTTLLGVMFGAAITCAGISSIRKQPTYTITAAGISAIPVDGMVDFGDVLITSILAWTDGHGAVVITDKVKCVYGVTGPDVTDTSLLSVGHKVHVRGHLYRKVETFPASSFDCETVQDDTP